MWPVDLRYLSGLTMRSACCSHAKERLPHCGCGCGCGRDSRARGAKSNVECDGDVDGEQHRRLQAFVAFQPDAEWTHLYSVEKKVAARICLMCPHVDSQLEFRSAVRLLVTAKSMAIAAIRTGEAPSGRVRPGFVGRG